MSDTTFYRMLVAVETVGALRTGAVVGDDDDLARAARCFFCRWYLSLP